jgi:hypothetical protein
MNTMIDTVTGKTISTKTVTMIARRESASVIPYPIADGGHKGNRIPTDEAIRVASGKHIGALDNVAHFVRIGGEFHRVSVV